VKTPEHPEHPEHSTAISFVTYLAASAVEHLFQDGYFARPAREWNTPQKRVFSIQINEQGMKR